MRERSPGCIWHLEGYILLGIGSSCHKVKVQLRVILLPRDATIRIDKLPCRGHHISQHARSPLAGHTFLGHAQPRKINTSQPYLGTIERSARRSKSYGAGVWAHRPLHTCTLRTRPEADLAPLIQVQAFQSNPARAAQSLTSRRLRLIPRRRVPITVPA